MPTIQPPSNVLFISSFLIYSADILVLDLKMYGINIEDKMGHYNFNNSSVFYTLYPDTEDKALLNEHATFGFERGSLMWDFSVQILNGDDDVLGFSCAFRSGKCHLIFSFSSFFSHLSGFSGAPVVNFKGEAISMATHVNVEERTMTSRYYGLNLCCNGDGIFRKIRGQKTVFSSNNNPKVTPDLAKEEGNFHSFIHL